MALSVPMPSRSAKRCRAVDRHEAGIAQARWRAAPACSRPPRRSSSSAPSGAGDQPTIGAGLAEPHADHHDRGVRRAPALGEQAPERRRRDQRRVAIEHQHVAREAGERARARRATAWAVPRCSCWTTVSAGRDGRRRPRPCRAPRPRAVRAGASGATRRQNVLDHRPVGDLVQHLGQVGSHPRALAGGKHQDGESGVRSWPEL